MSIKLVSTTAIAAALVAMTATASHAQTAPRAQAAPQEDNQLAEACLRDLNAFARSMIEDEFWLTGWGIGGYGTPPAPQSTAAPAATQPTTGGMTAPSEAGMDPRGTSIGVDAPRYQIRALYSASRVLAHRGDNEGCEYIVAKMNEVYDNHAQMLREAGVDPADVTTWRQEQLALAQPLAEGQGGYRIDAITGTEVRNPQDESLGSVSEVIIDPRTGTASYLLVARGGFLGIGDEHYAIPWSEIRATPGLDTLVVNLSEAELEQAPSVDPDRFRDPATMMEQRGATDQFWTGRG